MVTKVELLLLAVLVFYSAGSSSKLTLILEYLSFWHNFHSQSDYV